MSSKFKSKKTLETSNEKWLAKFKEFEEYVITKGHLPKVTDKTLYDWFHKYLSANKRIKEGKVLHKDYCKFDTNRFKKIEEVVHFLDYVNYVDIHHFGDTSRVKIRDKDMKSII